MRLNLRSLLRARGVRRKAVTLRPIRPAAALSSDLAAIYLQVVRAWEAALPRIEAAYARTLAQITTDSPADIQREIDAADAGLQRLLIALTPRLRDWAVRTEVWHRGRFSGAMLSATGIDLGTILSPADTARTVEAALAWNTDLIRNVSDQTKQRVASAVFQGVQQRRPARDVARQLREAVGMARQRSLLIASDQSAKLTAQLDQARQEAAGFDRYIWRHSGKRHPRESHVARDGKVFEWAKPPADGHPGAAIRCGCRAQAYLDLFEDEEE